MIKTIKQYLSLKFLSAKCEHDWVLHRTIGGNEVIKNITLQYDSRLMKWCDKCGKGGIPTKEEIKENPPIFRK